MTTDSPRHDRIPNANSPQLLTRLLEMVARGVRSTRGLQEALGVEGRTVLYYTQAADWLGLLGSNGEATLTPLGLEYVYADDGRAAVYARAVRSNPFLASLLGTGHRLPDGEALARAVAATEPDLAPATVRRRASSIRSLVAPALGQRPNPSAPVRQLPLPLTTPPAHRPRHLPERLVGGDFDPDLYRYVLRALLEHGELTLGHLRGLLDRAGAADCPIGGLVEMASQRGDAVRIEERWVATRAAVERKALVASTPSVMLSDPGFREHVRDLLLLTAHGAERREAEIRVERNRTRYRGWEQRLFGHAARPDKLSSDLSTLVLDRPIEAFPVAGPCDVTMLPVEEAFLDVWEQPGLAICLPPSLPQLGAGVEAVNKLLADLRKAPQVGLPTAAYRPVLYHGGIVHPGEPLPRSVPDSRSLRLRLAMHAPYPAMLLAFLLVHRQSPGMSLRRGALGWEFALGKVPVGPALALLDAFAVHRGWVPCRLDDALGAASLLDLLETLGLCVQVGGQAVLAERFFLQLRTEAEEMEVHEQLLPLGEAIHEYLGDA